MKITCNKICLTEKGLEFLTKERQDIVASYYDKQFSSSLEDSFIRSRSLPTINKHRTISQPTLIKQLSKMSRQKLKLEKISLKKLYQQKEDELIKRKLVQQLKDKHTYVQSIIPNLIKMTKSKKYNLKLQSRFEQARMYAARLQHNHQAKFLFRPKINSQHTK